jgi:hypothetical protein
MGSGSGGGYSQSVSLAANISAMSSKYPLTPSGHFGKAGPQKARVIESSDPIKEAKHFFLALSRGGQVVPIKYSSGRKEGHSKGLLANFEGKAFVSFRPRSSSDGSPAVQIVFKDGAGKSQKIHFIQKVEK